MASTSLNLGDLIFSDQMPTGFLQVAQKAFEAITTVLVYFAEAALLLGIGYAAYTMTVKRNNPLDELTPISGDFSGAALTSGLLPTIIKFVFGLGLGFLMGKLEGWLGSWGFDTGGKGESDSQAPGARDLMK